MSNAGTFIMLTMVFCIAGGLMFSILPALGGAFFGCSVVSAICAFVNYFEGK